MIYAVAMLCVLTALQLYVLYHFAQELVRLSLKLDHTHTVAHAAVEALQAHIQGAEVNFYPIHLRQDPEE